MYKHRYLGPIESLCKKKLAHAPRIFVSVAHATRTTRWRDEVKSGLKSIFVETQHARCAGDDRMDQRRRLRQKVIDEEARAGDFRLVEAGVAAGAERRLGGERALGHQVTAGDETEQPQVSGRASRRRARLLGLRGDEPVGRLSQGSEAGGKLTADGRQIVTRGARQRDVERRHFGEKSRR